MRRLRNIPHALNWKLYAGEGSTNYHHLLDFRNAHLGERCFLLGNGPSLARMNLAPLQNEITIGLNRIYLLFKQMGFETTYHVSINDLVIRQSVSEISNILASKFLNWRLRSLFGEHPNICYLHETYKPHFSTDITKSIWGGATVTYVAMQIAYYMGFEQVILIGVDHSFKTKGTPHTIVVSQEKDIDHFHPKYFADGIRWELPDLHTSEFAYQMAKEAFVRDGRQIVDATIDGQLWVFPKVNYLEILRE